MATILTLGILGSLWLGLVMVEAFRQRIREERTAMRRRY